MYRFDACTEETLHDAGWHEGRRITQQAAATIRDMRAPDGSAHVLFPAADAALAEFGNLYVFQDIDGADLRRRPFALDPTMAAATVDTLADLARAVGSRLFPLGVEGDGEAILAIDERGRVFALDHAGDWFLGDSIDAALVTLIDGSQPVRVRDDGTW